ALVAATRLGLPVRGLAVSVLQRLQLREVVLDGILSLLLFAGALNVDVAALRGQRVAVGALATTGVLASTFLVGVLMWWLARLIGLDLGFGE
ncbi:cation:proton antiporter domain-containing protein, partial [Vibrio parahaemolyticus]